MNKPPTFSAKKNQNLLDNYIFYQMQSPFMVNTCALDQLCLDANVCLSSQKAKAEIHAGI